jgi:hypothetical protein
MPVVICRHGRPLPEFDDRDASSGHPGLNTVFSFADALALNMCKQEVVGTNNDKSEYFD